MTSSSDREAPLPDLDWEEDEGEPPAEVTRLDSVMELLCRILLAAMVLMVGVEVIGRALFSFSLQFADEVSSYLLLAITFLSLSVSYVHGQFHHVEFILDKLTGRRRAILVVVFDLLALTFLAILVWQFIRIELLTIESGERAATFLATPLWVPRAAMVIGSIALLLAVLRNAGKNIKIALSRHPLD